MKNKDKEINKREIIIGIYKITNPRGNVYVGQSIDIFKRWDYYKKIKKGKYKKCLSILKYGANNHRFEILTECSINELGQLETLYKKFYLNKLGGWDKVLFHDLYDIGGGPRSQETKDKISKSNQKPKPHGFGKIISKLKKGTIRNKIKCPHCLKLVGGSMYFFHFDNCKMKEGNENIERKGRRLNKKGFNNKNVIQYDLQGNFLKEWKDQWEARDFLGFKNDGIGMVCRGKQKTAFGYKWEYKS